MPPVEVLNGLALCAGVGGLELGLKLVLGEQYRTVCWVEKRPTAVETLRAQMREGWLDDAPIWDDLTTFGGLCWRGKLSITTAGWPCQTHSTAARGRTVHPDLWPQVLRTVCESAASLVFLENVTAANWELVGADLEALGYTVPPPILVEAADLGAPHRRPRVFLLAHTDDAKQFAIAVDDEVARTQGSARNLPVPWVREPTATQLERLADGLPAGVVHKLSGEAVVPVVAAAAFATLAQRAGLLKL